MTNYSRFFESDAPGVREGDRRAATTMFVLTLATDYEGEAVLGVYSSEELAQSAADTFVMKRGQLGRSEQFELHEIVIDACAEYHW
jgi:hypothetical protein